MRITYLFFIGLFLLLYLSCKSSEEISDSPVPNSVIATIADEQITLDELTTNLNRNRNSEDVDSTEISEFFPSYINYRLKLHEGYQQGFQKDSAILAEFNEYASEIAYRYWIENEIKTERVETFRNRFKDEIQAFHILKELPENALPGDTLEVYNSLMAVRDSLQNGASPEEMNEQHSSKRDDRPIGGQLSWITAGTTIQPFEEVVYSLEPGEISRPVRSQFGYHLIILQDVRPRTPQRLVKHIFVRKNEDETGPEKINLAYEALDADTSWSNVLQNYTEDPSTKNRDGLLGWIGYGARFPTELVEAAMQTSPDSAYSKPIEVSYGYHIMKIDSVRTFKNEEQKEEFIVNRLQQLGRLDPDHEDVFDRIAKESNLKIYRENFRSLQQDAASLDEENGSSSENPLIYFFNKTYTNDDFQEWLDQANSMETIMESGDIIESFRDHIIEKKLVDYTKAQFPDYARQVDHFLNGLIVFKVNEENIWSPEAVDQELLREYYESNKNEYKKEKTYHYTETWASSDSLIREVHSTLSEDVAMEEIPKHFEDVFVSRDSTANSSNPVYEILTQLQPGEFSEPVSVEDREFIYKMNEIKEERILSFKEAYDRIFSDYQPIYEEKYLKKLKERYKLELYPENLTTE